MADPSVASASVAEALDLLRTHRPHPLDRPLPLTYTGIEPSLVSSSPPSDAGYCTQAVPSGGDGPLAAALAGQRDGSASSVNLVEAALAAIEERDGPLASVVEVRAAEALAEATAADDDRRVGRWRGSLHGVPVTVKDVIDVAGFHTRA
ncbi:MAG: amidase family protein, partial [Acidimicrobiales bacterium]